MDDSLLPSLLKATSKVVRQASRPGGSLEHGVFTMSIARSEIERAMGLDGGELGKGEWKGKVKEMVQDALDKVDNEPSSSQASSSKYPSPSPSPAPAKRGKNKSNTKDKSSSSKSRNKKSKSDEFTDDRSDAPKKSKGSSKDRPSKKGKKVESESEEDERIEGNESDLDDISPQMTPPLKSKSTSTSTKRTSAKKDKEEEETKKKASSPDMMYVEEPQARMSDSDMSSVYDEAPPSKSRKPLAATKRKPKSKSVSVMSSDDEKPSLKKRKSGSLSPDEARLADLKRIVVACGVRKQWAKEFADFPSTSSQIRHLQSLLSSIGMKGQPTLGKARTLKEKRELAQELDDVTTFEAARGVSSDTRASRSRAGGKNKMVDSDDEEEEEEPEEPIELDKEESALGAVLDLDFLGGDSDSD
uniref:Uncharacterized protein n=1 Tax=Kwoniella bestiolae CBS 10118 TaxID=1296100 RepID=A0A1B9G456_9TREE|nr:hypothetical protein I302_03488 [Kwoniella bestiolae CBS 10118]OCF25815.1 hypothetical protein I302_03488 [Kwoniella bestiolae CBS 10118]